MQRRSTRTHLLPLQTVLGGVCLLMASAAPLSEQSPADVESLVRDLADDHFAVREQASEQLWAMGRSVLPKLRELTMVRDPEQAVRARELVHKIELGIFPDSDPELLAIIEQYPRASATTKNALIRELQHRKAWRQMLKLHQQETDHSVRKQQESSMQRVAVHAAREKLAKGEKAEALEFLEMAPVSPESLLALAEYHRLHGSLERELRMAEGKPGTEMAAWRCALHRSAGNLERAILEARAAKLNQLAAALAVLDGDPVPWLELLAEEPEEGESRRLSDRVRILYARLAIQRWQGRATDAQAMMQLREILANRSSQYRRCARTALFMLGDIETAEASLIKESPMRGVQHLLMMERIDEALQVFGTTPQQPCTRTWVSEKFKGLEEDDFEEFDFSEQAQALHVMAGFLEARGLHQLAFECYRDPAREFSKRHEDGFLSLLMVLMNGGDGLFPAPVLAVSLASDWAGEDDQRWGRLTDFLWAGDGDSMEWWSHLAEIKPRSTRAERLRAVLVLSRRMPSLGNERREWIELAWKHHQQLAQEEQADSIKRLADLAFNSGDVELGARVWESMPADMRSAYYWRQQANHFSALNDWDSVCTILLEQVEAFSKREDGFSNPAFHAYAAGALRRAGRLEQAREHDAKAELLALGDPTMAMQIATAYAFADDYDRSREWWRRAALHSPPEGGMFALCINTYATALHDRPAQWPLVAAMAEVVCSHSIDNNYYDREIPLVDMRSRLKSDTFRALSKLQEDRSGSIALLEQCHGYFITDGVLADYFFPVLRQAGLIEEHDRWFALSWERFEQAIAAFPEAHNTRNTAGWFASRAQRKVTDAMEHQRHALRIHPEQPAYLDTMAEIHFALGQREEAMKWSRKAILNDPADAELRRQFHHFRHDPLPR